LIQSLAIAGMSKILLLPPIGIGDAYILIQVLLDFLNATSNAASGIYILVRDHELPEGIGCRMNGLVTQITVQVEFSPL